MPASSPLARVAGLVAVAALLLPGCPGQGQGDGLGAPDADPCGAGPWGAYGALGDMVFVSPDGRPDGDGSLEAPLASIRAALDLAANRDMAGVVVGALDAGTVYAEALDLDAPHRGLAILGRCADLVTIDASDFVGPGSYTGAIRVRSGPVRLAGLTLTGGDFGLVASCANDEEVPPKVDATNLIVTGNRKTGVRVSGGSEQRDSVLRLAHSQIVGNTGLGVYSTSRGTAHLVDCVVQSTDPGDEAELSGAGIDVRGGGRVVAERTSILDNHIYGVHVAGPGSTALLRHSEVLDTLPSDSQNSGVGLCIAEGGALEAIDLLVAGSLQRGVWATGPQSRVLLDDVTVREVREAVGRGRGIEVADGALLQASDCIVEDTWDHGVLATDSGEARLLRTTLSGNQAGQADLGAAISATDGGAVRARDGRVEHVDYAAVQASDAGSLVQLSDMVISDVQLAESAGIYGGARGIRVEAGGQVRAERVSIADVGGAGILVYQDGSLLEFEDLEIRGTGPSPDGGEGFGLAVEWGGRAEGRHLVTGGNWRYSVRAAQDGSTVLIEDSDIGAADPQDFAPDHVGGININSGAAAELRDVRFLDPLGPALFAWGGAELKTDRLLVRGGQALDDPAGFVVQSGSSLRDSNSIIDETLEVGLSVSGPGTRVHLDGTRISRIRPNSDGRRGRGISLRNEAELTAVDLKITDSHDIGLSTYWGARAELIRGTVSGTRAGERPGSGVGILANVGARVILDGTRIEDSDGPGVIATLGGTISGTQVELSGNTLAGAIASTGGTLRLEDSEINGTRPHPGDGGGVGVFSYNLGFTPIVELHRVVVRETAGPAIYLTGTGRRIIERCRFEGLQATTWLPGGLFAGDVPPGGVVFDAAGPIGTLLRVSDTFFEDMETAVLLDNGTGLFDGNVFHDVETPMCRQRSDDVPLPTIDGEDIALDSCSEYLVPTRPLLTYTVGAVDLVEDIGTE